MVYIHMDINLFVSEPLRFWAIEKNGLSGYIQILYSQSQYLCTLPTKKNWGAKFTRFRI